MFQKSHVLVGVLSLATVACNDSTNGNFVHIVAVATVRFVNATDAPITVSNGGVIDSLNIRLGFAHQSSCLLVDLSGGTTVPLLTFTDAVSGAVLTGFNVPIPVGGNVTIVAFADTNGVVSFAGMSNRFTPPAGKGALRFFNAVQATGSLMMLGDGVSLTPFIAFGAASNFASVRVGSTAVTFTNGTSTVLDAGLQTLGDGQTTTLVVGPPAAGTTPLRFFPVHSC
jgi:hypothetical protein